MRRITLSKAGEIAERELRDSHLDVVALNEVRVELRGHNRQRKDGPAFILYGMLPLLASIYFLYKGQLIIFTLCAALGLLVLLVRVTSRRNTKSCFLIIDKKAGRLHYKNAGDEPVQESVDGIQSVHSQVTKVLNDAWKSSYMAHVNVHTSDGHKLTVAQFEDITQHRPTRQAKALGHFLGSFLGRPYEHNNNVCMV